MALRLKGLAQSSPFACSTSWSPARPQHTHQRTMSALHAELESQCGFLVQWFQRCVSCGSVEALATIAAVEGPHRV